MNTHIDEIMGKKVTFYSGAKRLKITGTVERVDGRFVVVKGDDGKERKTYPGACSLV